MHNKSKALDWIKYSERDRDIASHLMENYHPLPANIICWLCQQSVEKAYKAILAYYDEKIPKIHDIRLLQKLTSEHEPVVNIDVKIADKLTEFATESRYPDNVFDFTREDVDFGLKYAAQVLSKVKDVLKQLYEQDPYDVKDSDC